MQQTRTIELDVEQPRDRRLLDVKAAERRVGAAVKSFGVKVELSSAIGPTEGWPIFAFTGTDAQLREMLRVWYLKDSKYTPGSLEEEIDFILDT